MTIRVLLADDQALFREALRTLLEVQSGIEVVGEADEPGWEVDPDDEWGIAVIATVGRQLRLRREAVGMRAADFGKAVGYGEDMVYKIESGKRIPRPEFLDTADGVLQADGLVSAMKEDVEKVREYLRTNKRPTIMDVHYMTGIPVQTIQQFIKEGIINRGS